MKMTLALLMAVVLLALPVSALAAPGGPALPPRAAAEPEAKRSLWHGAGAL